MHDEKTNRPGRLTELEAAAYVGVKPHTLATWRSTRRHAIPFIKVGSLIQYWKHDLDAWLEKQTVEVAGIVPTKGGAA